MNRSRRGFTIVELAVVISVIGILYVIGLVSYNGIQDRARDVERLTDMKNITEALEIYKNREKGYPYTQPDPNGSWEESYHPSFSFLDELKSKGFTNSVPVDPLNSLDNHYRYYQYAAGSYGCDSSKGRFYVLQIIDKSRSGEISPDSPGFSCGTRTWDGEAWYTVGRFVNG